MEDHSFDINDDLLWDYADGLLSEDENRRLADYLNAHPEWVPRLQAIGAERRLLQSTPLEAPPAGFADQVLKAWAEMQSPPVESADWIIRGIGLVFSLFILLPLGLFIAKGLQGNTTAGITLPEIPKVDWIGLLSHPILQYGLYFVFTMLALRLLSAVLSQYKSMHQMVV